MTSVIVLFPKIENAKNIRNLLVKNGFNVTAVCTTGAQALTYAEELNDGIVVCGYKYADMIYSELREYLSECIDMLLVASRGHWEDAQSDNIMCVEMPLKVHELLSTVQMMVEIAERRRRKRKAVPKERSSEEKQIIKDAKELLMARNNMSEEDAYRYIQKISMDSGTNMVETAQMVMGLYS